MLRASWLYLLLLVGACDQVFGLERPETPPLPPGDWSVVAAGSDHTCGIRLDGTLWCWGENKDGQLGIVGGNLERPAQVGTDRWITVAGGGDHTCAIQEDRSLWCWGSGAYGQLGLGLVQSALTPMRVSAGPWQAVVAGIHTTCALDVAGDRWCTGANNVGQLGVGSTSDAAVMTPLFESGVKWRSIALERFHGCGIKEDDSLWCWGSNHRGALADPNAAPEAIRQVPFPADGGPYGEVAVGLWFTCARRLDGHLTCWGTNTYGALGDGTTSDNILGGVVGNDASDWTSLAASEEFTCGIHGDGGLACWGANQYGQIPSAAIGAVSSSPVEIVAPAERWAAVALGARHSCAIDDAHRLWCAGSNGSGQLGIGGAVHLTPEQVPGTWHAVRAGRSFTCALDDLDAVWCWGDNAQAQLGDVSRLPRQAPILVHAVGPWDALVVGSFHACVRKAGSRWCWGDNEQGELGDGDYTSPIFRPRSINALWPESAAQHACVIESGKLSCWGYNDHGELGIGTFTKTSIPTGVQTTIMTWRTVAVGATHTCAVAATGMYCWGEGNEGSIGDGMFNSSTVPVASLSPVGAPGVLYDRLAMGTRHGCALAGTAAYCWGANGDGQLGIAAVSQAGRVSIPTLLPGAWSALALASHHTCGIHSDGSLACWGGNPYGELGDGTATRQVVPVAVGTDATWKEVTTGENHTCALKTDGSLWCWGDNRVGQLGIGAAWQQVFDRVE